MSHKPKTSDVTSANRKAWNASADHHKASARWQELVTGFGSARYSTFDATLTAILEGVDLREKSVVQIGCNNGREVLSLARFGAIDCLGIDQSSEFLAQAEDLRKIAGQACTFLCADIYQLPETTPGNFDVVLITIGVLNWMPDLSRFFEIVNGLLAPGGTIVIYETHPFLDMFDPHGPTPLTPTGSYFRADPFIETAALTYDGSTHESETSSYWFVHKLSDIVNGCIDAGFQISRLQEYPHSNREVDYDIYEGQPAQIPMCFSLVAQKTGSGH